MLRNSAILSWPAALKCLADWQDGNRNSDPGARKVSYCKGYVVLYMSKKLKTSLANTKVCQHFSPISSSCRHSFNAIQVTLVTPVLQHPEKFPTAERVRCHTDERDVIFAFICDVTRSAVGQKFSPD